jgi:hypothetical protein
MDSTEDVFSNCPAELIAGTTDRRSEIRFCAVDYAEKAPLSIWNPDTFVAGA